MDIVFLCILFGLFGVLWPRCAFIALDFFSGRSCRPVVDCSGCRLLIVSRDIGVVCNSWPGRFFVWYGFFFSSATSPTPRLLCQTRCSSSAERCQLNCVQSGHTRKVRGNMRSWNPLFSGFSNASASGSRANEIHSDSRRS